jgi:hypothetical protein
MLPAEPHFIHPDCPFTSQAFELLARLHNQPTISFYLENQQQFQTYIEEPFQRIMRRVATQLSEPVRNVMSTEKRIFSRFTKKDPDQAGAWDFYWGAFYPRSTRQLEDVQLSLWMNYKRFEIGFYIGSYGTTARNRFQTNCRKHGGKLLHLLDPLLVEGSILLGTQDNVDIDSNGSLVVKKKISWEEWFRDPAQANYDASLVLPKDQVFKLSEQALVDTITYTFEKLFPLVLLATLDEPVPAVLEYLGQSQSHA